MNLQIHTFTLDPFQEKAIASLKKGVSVVVSAPTGAGKTAIAEYVIEEALKTKERVFYTTPLKALSNQKFHDFQKKYGRENVGIVTGDTSVNRDAQIVVMTTEIYRNMLYGTILGSVDENLKHLRYLVLDECHYMNDPDRGTVWEESIIYSPQNLQILALSATIANAKDLTAWISQVHSKTELIETFYRPVPLRFYYFTETHLYPLLTTNNQLNPQLKEHKDSFKAHKQKFRDLKKHNKSKKEGTIPDMINELHKRGFLPSIYFVFSRRGCELALKEAQKLGFGLLTLEERQTLSRLIQETTYGNEYLFKHRHLGALYQGMAVHHAGLLPQWKVMVESLFSKGLIKVVFATETLAAGINMPAKTTIISNLGKRGDAGHQNLSSNQFLQMSGRAGRRGMDKVGNVVIKETIDHSAAFAAKIATSPPEPLVSQFTPNYSMVLNLLQNHSVEQIKDLLNKSFGQYLLNRDLTNFMKEKNDLEKEQGGIQKQEEKIKETGGIKENYYRMEKRARKNELRLKEINKSINQIGHYYWNEFIKLRNILDTLGYLKNNIPTEKGIMAASLRGENIILIAEVLLNCDFAIGTGRDQRLQAGEFAACISSLAIDESRPRTYTKARASYYVDDVFISIQKLTRNLLKLQRDNGVKISVNINPLLAGLVQLWCKEETKWEDLLRVTNLDEGDMVRAGRRTIDLLRHIKNAPYLDPEITRLAKDAFELMDKEPVKEVV
ncbi:MAG: hypothetical protein A3I68_05870 [Candidatus Melainabacteria bacterium RIFCSPLOWO2_02_FULL_35_15]|nr:MAG: hypothetical protein A3F80_05155 [Candidatus Melainabacteria bacterium RIFCSPLOWO2_12_FULL_35_11]OGI13892.1 MAG: hypothetical protein A3I68_05870 [Candidatus Melainabacteria bacterium RIFCSPLOWO2_02_FULL_35_15]